MWSLPSWTQDILLYAGLRIHVYIDWAWNVVANTIWPDPESWAIQPQRLYELATISSRTPFFYTYNNKQYVIICSNSTPPSIPKDAHEGLDKTTPFLLLARNDTGDDILDKVMRFAGPRGDFHNFLDHTPILSDISDAPIMITDTNFVEYRFENPNESVCWKN